MNRAAASPPTPDGLLLLPSSVPLLPPRTHLIILLLILFLSYRTQGVESYRVVAPARYIALQGHLNATVYLTPTTPAKDTSVYTWDTENQTFIPKSPSSSVPDSDSRNSLLPNGYEGNDSNEIPPDPLTEFTEPMQPLPVVAIGRDDYVQELPDVPPLPPKLRDLETSLSLSLYANGSLAPIHTLPVVEGASEGTYQFMCGLVVQGGTYFFRLQRGEEVLASSGNVEVAWPDISLEVPKEVETYHSDVQVILRFNVELCKPLKPVAFHAWIELLYHGVRVGKEGSPGSKRCGIPDPKRNWNRTLWDSIQDDLRNRRALRKSRKKVSGRGKKGKNGRKNGKRRNPTKGGRRRKNKNGRRRGLRKYGGVRGGRQDLVGGRGELSEDTQVVEESVVESDSVNSFVVDASTNSIISNGSTNKTDVAWTPSPSSSNVARTPGPYESKTTVGGVSIIVRGRKKGRRRRKGRRKTKEEVDVDARVTKKRQMHEGDSSGGEVPVTTKLKNKENNRLRRKHQENRRKKRKRIKNRVSSEGNDTDRPSAKKKAARKQDENSGLGISENISEDITAFPDTTDYESPVPGTQTFIPTEDVTDLVDYIYSDEDSIPINQQGTDSGFSPEESTLGFQENLLFSSTQIPPLVMPLSETEDSFPPFEGDTVPFQGDLNPNSSGSGSKSELFQNEQVNRIAPISTNEATSPSALESTPVSPERNLVTAQGSLPFREEDSGSDKQPVPKTKRNIAAEENRQHSTYLKRPQAAMVSSGFRGKGWAWGGNAVVLGRVPLQDNLYSFQSRDVKFPCSDIGPAGIYSVRLVTDIYTNSVITNSEWFMVDWSDSFSIYVHAASIVPCSGAVGVQVTYPACIGGSDKVRVYARIRANVTSINPPIDNKYVAERRIIKGRTSVQFPCDTFNDYATEFCFFYVNTAKTGAVSDIDKCCVPTYKQHVIRENGQWGAWNSWSDCTAKCGTGERLRHRFCDSPRPRSGGEYCVGDSVDSLPCESMDCVEPSLYSPPASTPGGERCGCGCTLELTLGVPLNITASAADCTGTAVWLFQASEGERVTAEVVWAVLRPGTQWLKLRDGDSLSSPLLVRLPGPKALNSSPSPRQLSQAPPQTSLGNNLVLEFRSDINVTAATINPASWGFLVRVSSTSSFSATAAGTLDEAAHSGMYWKLLAGMHIAAVVFISALVAAVIVLAVYNWRRYRLYRRAKLIPESPYITPPSTPSREVATGSSTLTLTEVISLKSMVFRPKIPVSLPLRRKGSTSSYSALDERPPEEPRHSLPNSPFLTRRAVTPSTIRRSSSQLGRFLRKGNGNFKKKKRRFGSVDELEIRCISPIHETHKEEEGGGADKDETTDNKNKNGEDDSAKYKEYRKSLIGSDAKDIRLPHKLVKDKMNLERVRRSAISRSNSNATMRGSSSVSDISVNGTDTEMEYDYYDYDMDNASAVPGSLFGLDPLLLAWVPPFIPMGECTPPNEGIPLDVIVSASVHEVEGESVTPTAEQPIRPKVLPLEHLNILPTEPPPPNPMQTSIRSEEANDRIELQVKAPEETPSQACDDDPTPTTEVCSKILNLDEFQFADDTDEDEELSDL
ncbi:uncharacterized protein LOC135203711 [Macrobrachium nipponense]|uniref:uncharacterized protein LOC135203711 n=1 Tax=Macrobrachium nipponense TaxID=159736 RepID=UPI0030C840CF